jgi:hypothetical protein
MTLPGPYVDSATFGQQFNVRADVTVVRRHESDRAVLVLVIVPAHEARYPRDGVEASLAKRCEV